MIREELIEVLVETVSRSRRDLVKRMKARAEKNQKFPVAPLDRTMGTDAVFYGASPSDTGAKRVLKNLSATSFRTLHAQNSRLDRGAARRKYPGLIRRAAKDKTLRSYLKRQMKQDLWDMGATTKGGKFDRTARSKKMIRKIRAGV